MTEEIKAIIEEMAEINELFDESFDELFEDYELED